MKHHQIPEPINGVIRYDATITSIARPKDENNCVLRAMAVAFDEPIDKSGDFAGKLGRQYRKGTPRPVSKKLIEKYRMVEVFTQRGSLHGAIPIRAISIREAIKRFPSGRYIFKTRKHWFAVIDGCPVDLADWFNRVNQYEDFKSGDIIDLAGWDHKVYKIWRCS